MNNLTKKIRVGIDCRDLFVATTGSKTYLSEIVRVFKDTKFTDIEYVELYPFVPIFKSKGVLGKIIKHIQFFCWKQISLPCLAKFKKCQILFCSDYFLPILNFNFKQIVVFHDAFFFEHPHHYNRFWLELFHRLAIPAAKRANKIVVPSLYVKKRLQSYMHLEPDKFIVVYEAPKSIPFNVINKNDSIEWVKFTPYLLHVGVLNQHKNLTSLIKSFKIARLDAGKDWHLVLVGSPGSSKADDDTVNILKLIDEQQLQEKIHLVGYVSDDLLGHYYSNASGYICPSYNEGFGLPLLEAMKFKLPVAAANNTCLPEICKDAAIYFDPFNIDQMSSALQKIMQMEQDVVKSVQSQSEVLATYSWRKAALEITAICKDLVR